ncbi:MAG: MurR/RpiR family transcriptional regulator [bacterium]|nr:MurR/RpiR family transcriptional regulator [bacterium]
MIRIDQIVKGRTRDLTSTQRNVLDFILKHPEDAAFYTATELAAKLEVSDTTIVRLAQALGYKGYPHLKRKLREFVQPRVTTVQRLGETVRRVESIADVLNSVMARDLNNLKMTMEETDPALFTAVVHEMDKAKRIFIIALRSTHCLGVFMASALKFLGRDVVLLTPGIGEMPDQMRDLGKKDLVIGFAFPRYTRVTVEVLREARERGARVVAVTDGELSPLNRFAHHSLTAAYELDSHVESFTAALSLVNAQVTALAFESRADTLNILNDMEDAWEKQNVYWKG